MLTLYMIVVLPVLGWLVYRIFLDPLSHVPGPFISKFIPLHYIRMIRERTQIFSLKDLHDTYGPVVRLGPSDLSFATISAFDSIYGSAAEKTFTIAGTRRNLLVPKDTVVDIMLSNCIGKDIRSWLRPMVASTLSEITGACSERLFNAAFTAGLKLHQVGQKESTSTDLSGLNNDYMWDLGSLIAFGRHAKLGGRLKFDAILDGGEYFMCFLEVCFCFFDRFTVQKYQPAFDKTWRLLCKLAGKPPIDFGPDDQSHVTYENNQHARLKVAAKKAGKGDTIDTYLQMNSLSTQLSVYSTANTSINIIFYYLLKNAECFNKLEEELLSTFQSYGEICDQRLATLPYLNACISESLRIAPPFSAGILQRVSQGAAVDGVYIPPGTGVQVDQYSLGNSEEHWDSAGSFLPERWFDPNARKTEKASRPFLIGARQCPGRNMALQFLRLAVGKMVYLYHMEMVNKDFDIAQHSSSCLSWTNVNVVVSMKPREAGVFGYE